MKFLVRSIFRVGITILLTLIILINIKKNVEFKNKFYELVYETNIDFAYINSLYKNYFGSSIPFEQFFTTKQVFNETLEYNSQEPYLDGVKLGISQEYLIPVNKSGLVVFIGEKEEYGNVVVIEQVDGIDCWYGNLETVNVKLYDYVEEGSLLGSASNSLFLVYKDKGEIISYEKYLS